MSGSVGDGTVGGPAGVGVGGEPGGDCGRCTGLGRRHPILGLGLGLGLGRRVGRAGGPIVGGPVCGCLW